MTNDEAIHFLSVLWERINRNEAKIEVRDIPIECIDMAIEALTKEEDK